MRKYISTLANLFTDERFLTSILVVYALVVFCGEQFAGGFFTYTVWVWIDFVCTFVFLVEMFIKIRQYGFRCYIHNSWFDAFVVVLSIPSLLVPFVNIGTLHMVVILRLLRLGRIMRVFLLFQYLPNIHKLLKGFLSGMRQTSSVLLGFFIVMFVFGLISYALFKDVCTQFFGTPLQSLHSMFQLFIIDGWLEITHAVSEGMTPMGRELVYFYFVALIALLGVVGMAFITSIFVDAMGEKDSDDVQRKLHRISKQMDAMLEKQTELEKRLTDNK